MSASGESHQDADPVDRSTGNVRQLPAESASGGELVAWPEVDADFSEGSGSAPGESEPDASAEGAAKPQRGEVAESRDESDDSTMDRSASDPETVSGAQTDLGHTNGRKSSTKPESSGEARGVDDTAEPDIASDTDPAAEAHPDPVAHSAPDGVTDSERARKPPADVEPVAEPESGPEASSVAMDEADEEPAERQLDEDVEPDSDTTELSRPQPAEDIQPMSAEPEPGSTGEGTPPIELETPDEPETVEVSIPETEPNTVVADSSEGGEHVDQVDDPVDQSSIADDPADVEHIEDDPNIVATVVHEPIVDQPTTGEPAAAQHVAAEISDQETTVGERTVRGLAIVDSAVETPFIPDETAAEEEGPAVQEAVEWLVNSAIAADLDQLTDEDASPGASPDLDEDPDGDTLSVPKADAKSTESVRSEPVDLFTPAHEPSLPSETAQRVIDEPQRESEAQEPITGPDHSPAEPDGLKGTVPWSADATRVLPPLQPVRDQQPDSIFTPPAEDTQILPRVGPTESIERSVADAQRFNAKSVAPVPVVNPQAEVAAPEDEPTVETAVPQRETPAQTGATQVELTSAQVPTEPLPAPPKPAVPPQEAPHRQQAPPDPERQVARSQPRRIESATAGETVAKPRRKRRWLITAIVMLLVLGAGVGVISTVPGVAAKIGLPKLGPVTTASPPAPVVPKFALRAVSDQAPEPTAAGIKAALAQVTSNPTLATLTGTVIDPASGDTLWQQGASTPLAPGSTTKLLTAAAALLVLDPQATLDTKVVAGNQPGTVVLVGGGDPTLSSLPSGRESVYTGAAHLSNLVDQVKRNSGRSITKVFIDQSRYAGDSKATGWLPQDIQAGNWTPLVPGMLDGGRSDPTMAEETPRSQNPGGDLLRTFAAELGATGVGNSSAPPGAPVLGEVHSAPVQDLVDNMLTISDNVLAEALGREVARSQGLPESFDGAKTAILKVLADNGFDTTGVVLDDCSGLSTMDKMPAKLLASVLAAAAGPDGDNPRTAKLRSMLVGLPVAGGTGTLDDRYADSASAAGKGWVRAKTGSLAGVNTLAGIVQNRDNRILVFAMMSNGSDVATGRAALDSIAATLRECGCRG